MAFASSYVNGYHLSQMLVNGAAYNLDSDSIRVSLYTDSIGTMDKNANEVKGGGVYTSNEVSYTGSSVTPGSGANPGTLTNPTITAAAGVIKFADSSTTMAWTNATWTARGAAIWDDTLTSPADPVLCAINFGANKQVTVGTFTITWDTAGIFVATY